MGMRMGSLQDISMAESGSLVQSAWQSQVTELRTPNDAKRSLLKSPLPLGKDLHENMDHNHGMVEAQLQI